MLIEYGGCGGSGIGFGNGDGCADGETLVVIGDGGSPNGRGSW